MLLTSLHAAIFGLIFVFLSFRTIRLRQKFRTSLGDGQQPLLQRAIRVHGNFAEYVPFTMLLIYFIEAQTANKILINFLCIGLLIARISHAYGVSQVEEKLHFRIFGMVTTGLIISISSILLLTKSFI
jgi:uncharacterized protein